MLYDPKWEKQTETKADPFQLGTLIAWLEKQPPAMAYDYGCTGHCMLAQHLTDRGYRNVLMGERVWSHGDHSMTNTLAPIFNKIARDGRRTFGAALERARAAARS